MDYLYELDQIDAAAIAACASLSLDGVEGVVWNEKERERLQRAIAVLCKSGIYPLEIKQKEK